jgi:hypothetical protein
VLALVFLVVVASPARADLLAFPDNACSANADGSGAFTACVNFSFFNQNYGDSANVDVSYVDVARGTSMSWWDADYNELRGVIWGGFNDSPGNSWNRIEISPIAAGGITLNGFDLGAWPHNVLDTHLRILDLATDGVLFDYGALTIGIGDLSSHFASGIFSASGIVIEFRDTGYNVGIDNIDFTVNDPHAVPEPGTMSLLAAGLIAGASLARRRRM